MPQLSGGSLVVLGLLLTIMVVALARRGVWQNVWKASTTGGYSIVPINPIPGL